MPASTQTQNANESSDWSIHCKICNSHVRTRDLLKRSFSGEQSPSCPNCGRPIPNLAITAQSPADVPEGNMLPVDPVALGEFRYCPNCGHRYSRYSGDERLGETRPTRFCPNCGNPVALRP